MRKTREYKGCELESPIYRQIVAEGYYKDKINKEYNELKVKESHVIA